MRLAMQSVRRKTLPALRVHLFSQEVSRAAAFSVRARLSHTSATRVPCFRCDFRCCSSRLPFALLAVSLTSINPADDRCIRNCWSHGARCALCWRPPQRTKYTSGPTTPTAFRLRPVRRAPHASDKVNLQSARAQTQTHTHVRVLDSSRFRTRVPYACVGHAGRLPLRRSPACLIGFARLHRRIESSSTSTSRTIGAPRSRRQNHRVDC